MPQRSSRIVYLTGCALHLFAANRLSTEKGSPPSGKIRAGVPQSFHRRRLVAERGAA